MLRCGLVCAFALAWWPATAQEALRSDVPIVVGGASSTPACPGGGYVTGLDPLGDNFLSVRSGPGGRGFREVDRLSSGVHLKICDMLGPWFGVVYNSEGDPGACDLDRPWPERGRYAGACRQGWVHSRYVNPVPR